MSARVSHFDGRTYAARDDHARLASQLQRVAHVLVNTDWVTLEEIRRVVDRLAGIGRDEPGGATEAAISARIRDLRKPKFAGVAIDRDRRTGGLWFYRVAHADRERLRRWLHEVAR